MWPSCIPFPPPKKMLFSKIFTTSALDHSSLQPRLKCKLLHSSVCWFFSSTQTSPLSFPQATAPTHSGGNSHGGTRVIRDVISTDQVKQATSSHVTLNWDLESWNFEALWSLKRSSTPAFYLHRKWGLRPDRTCSQSCGWLMAYLGTFRTILSMLFPSPLADCLHFLICTMGTVRIIDEKEWPKTTIGAWEIENHI